VWLHPDVVQRIQRKAVEAPDPEFVLSHMAGTILRPRWVGFEGRSPRRAGHVHLVGAHELPLCVTVRFVAGGKSLSGLDEIWVSGAFPLGPRSLTRLRRRDRLVAVEWEADD
jgi:hypothetical protein